MQLSHVSLLPVCHFSTVSWPCVAARGAGARWDESLRALASASVVSDASATKDDETAALLSHVLSCALIRCDAVVARDAISFLAQHRWLQQQQQASEATARECAGLLLAAGLASAVVELQQQQQCASRGEEPYGVVLPPLQPRPFDVVLSGSSKLLALCPADVELAARAKAILRAELFLCSGDIKAARRELDSIAMDQHTGSSASPLFEEWRVVLCDLISLLAAEMDAAAWSRKMVDFVAASPAQAEADDPSASSTRSLSAQLRGRAALLLFDTDFWSEHLFLSATPLQAQSLPRVHHPEPVAACAAHMTTGSRAVATSGTSGDDDEAAHVMGARIALRVARAKLAAFISSRGDNGETDASLAVSAITAAVETLVSTLNDAQRRVAQVQNVGCFSIVMQEALESVCACALFALSKIVFAAQAQLTLRIVTSPGDDGAAPPQEKPSLVAFLTSFAALFASDREKDTTVGSNGREVRTISLAYLRAVALHLRQRIGEALQLRRTTAATRHFSDSRLRVLAEMAASVALVLGCKPDGDDDDVPQTESVQERRLVNLLEVSSTESTNALFSARLQLRRRFFGHTRVVPVGDGINTRFALIASSTIAADDEIARRHSEALASKSAALRREQALFSRLM